MAHEGYEDTDTGKPLQCWIKDEKILLVLSKRILTYDINLERIDEIILKTLIPQASFATCAKLAFQFSSAGQLTFWLGTVGPNRKIAQLEHDRKFQGKVFPAYGSYITKIVWSTF